MTPNIDRIHEVLKQWHEAGRPIFEKMYNSLNYDSPHSLKSVVYKSRYACLDEGTSGAFLVDMTGDDRGHAPGKIYRIKSKYGVPNFKKCVGDLATIDGKVLAELRWR